MLYVIYTWSGTAQKKTFLWDKILMRSLELFFKNGKHEKYIYIGLYFLKRDHLLSSVYLLDLIKEELHSFHNDACISNTGHGRPLMDPI